MICSDAFRVSFQDLVYLVLLFCSFIYLFLLGFHGPSRLFHSL